MGNRKKKCGIVTFHSSHNYGSVLQAYAMVRVMQKMGLDAELIDFRHPRTTDMYEWRLWSTYKNWYCVAYSVLGKNGNRYSLILLKMC